MNIDNANVEIFPKEEIKYGEMLRESGPLERSLLGEPVDIKLPEDGKLVRIIATRKKHGQYYVAYSPIENGIADPDKLDLAVFDITQPEMASIANENAPTHIGDIFQKIKEGINSRDLDYKNRFLWTNRLILSGGVLSWLTRHALAVANSTASTPNDLPIFESIRNNSQFFYPFVQWDKVSDFGIFSLINTKLPTKDTKILPFPKDVYDHSGSMLMAYTVYYEIIFSTFSKKLMGESNNGYGLGSFDPLDVLTEVGGAIFATASRNELLKRIQEPRTDTINDKLREKILEQLKEKDGLNTLFDNQKIQSQKSDSEIFKHLLGQMRELFAITETSLADIEQSLGNNEEARELLRKYSRAYTVNFVRQFCSPEVKVENEKWAWKTLMKKEDTARLLNEYRTKI